MDSTTLAAPVLSRIAELLNRNIERSTPGRAARARLAGRSFAVRVEGVGLRVRLAATDSAIALTLDSEPAAAEVAGGPLALLSLLRSSTPVAGSAGVSISGDPEVAQAFQKLLAIGRPELEAELARFVGEAPAHLAARFAGRLAAFAERLRSTTSHSVAEYLTEESRDLPAKAEADVYGREVDRLRDDVERASARLALLEQRAKARRSDAC